MCRTRFQRRLDLSVGLKRPILGSSKILILPFDQKNISLKATPIGPIVFSWNGLKGYRGDDKRLMADKLTG